MSCVYSFVSISRAAISWYEKDDLYELYFWSLIKIPKGSTYPQNICNVMVYGFATVFYIATYGNFTLFYSVCKWMNLISVSQQAILRWCECWQRMILRRNYATILKIEDTGWPTGQEWNSITQQCILLDLLTFRSIRLDAGIFFPFNAFDD